MMDTAKRILFAAIWLLFLLLTAAGLPQNASAAVVVFDRVTSIGKPVFVKVVTRGLFLTKGGQRVTIRIGNGPAHQTLSGADGAAYIKYHPDEAGFQEVTAVSENEEGVGTILVLEPGESVVVIDVEGGLLQSLYPEEKRREAREVLSWLNQKYRLVYLTRWVGAGLVKNRLKTEQFPQSVVLPWRGEGIFKQMENNAVRVEMVIGSDALLRAAPESIKWRFTFDKKNDAALSGWEEVREKLEGQSGQTEKASSQQQKAPPKP